MPQLPAVATEDSRGKVSRQPSAKGISGGTPRKTARSASKSLQKLPSASKVGHTPSDKRLTSKADSLGTAGSEEDLEAINLEDVEGLPMLISLSQRMDPEVRNLLTAIIEGRRLLSKGFVKESMARLHDAIKCALGYELDDAQFRALRAKSAKKLESGNARKPVKPLVMPPAFPTKDQLGRPPPPTSEDMLAQTIKLLCLCHSRTGDWRDVCKYADIGLELDMIPLNKNEDLKHELLLRRGIALSHMADQGAKKPPRMTDLKCAARDLQEVLKHKPRDALVLRGLENVAFLQTQAAIGDKLQRFEEASPLRGLAKLRAMDP